MKVYATRNFARFRKREHLTDEALRRAAKAIAEGNADVDLGGGVFKQRIARPGSGKSGGYRTLILHKRGDAYIFSYGFAKSSRANIDDAELKAFRELAAVYGRFTAREFESAVEVGELIEVRDDEDDEGNEASEDA